MDELISLWVYLVIAIALATSIPVWIAWFSAPGVQKQVRGRPKAELQRLGLVEEAYQQWLRQSQHAQMALEKERIQILNLSPKAFAQFVADLPSVLCRVEYFFGLAERQLPNGSP